MSYTKLRNATLGLIALAVLLAGFLQASPDQVAAAAPGQNSAISLAQATEALNTGRPAHGTPALTSGAAAAGRSGVVKVLMLLCNPYGANYNWVRDVQETYGWDVTTAALVPVVNACYVGGPLTVDTLINEIGDVSEFDCLELMPGPGLRYGALVNSPEVLALVNQADSLGLLLTAHCGGTRVLAAAGVLEGHRVTGDAGFIQEYLDAGAIWAGEPVHPVLDGNVLTTTRNQTHAWRTCELMRTAIDSLRTARE